MHAIELRLSNVLPCLEQYISWNFVEHAQSQVSHTPGIHYGDMSYKPALCSVLYTQLYS